MQKIFVTDSYGEDHILEFRKHEFRNLMELLVDRLYYDIGNAREGRYAAPAISVFGPRAKCWENKN